MTLDAYSINYVIGMGILGIPYAVVQGGILLAILVLVIVAFLSLISSMWIVEVRNLSLPHFNHTHAENRFAFQSTSRAQAVINLANRDLDTTELDPLVKKVPFQSHPNVPASSLTVFSLISITTLSS